MNKTNRQAGFVLIEVVSTLILIGIIGAFTGFFLYYGITGFLASKRNSEDALKVQVAMDRISAELRDIKASPKPIFEAKKVTYQSDTLTLPPGDRVLQIENDVQCAWYLSDGWRHQEYFAGQRESRQI